MVALTKFPSPSALPSPQPLAEADVTQITNPSWGPEPRVRTPRTGAPAAPTLVSRSCLGPLDTGGSERGSLRTRRGVAPLREVGPKYTWVPLTKGALRGKKSYLAHTGDYTII